MTPFPRPPCRVLRPDSPPATPLRTWIAETATLLLTIAACGVWLVFLYGIFGG